MVVKHWGVLLLLVLVAACSARDLETGQSLTLVERKPLEFASWSDVLPPYRLGTGDKLKVKFLITRDMDEEVTVNPDGMVGLRSTGQLQAEGQTVVGLQRDIALAAARVVTPQEVVVSLEDAASSKIYVGGSVRAPGAYKITERKLSALQAILIAGGFDREARFDEVGLIRRSPTGGPMLKIINVREIIQTSTHQTDVPMLSGDILYVPRNSISELGLWIEQFITKILPFDRHFTYTIGQTVSGGSVRF
ncbi:MAG: polysaccharide biosynthesis/export family protein [Alphaproteobacteria bacterium]